jgi:hypothetical protein
MAQFNLMVKTLRHFKSKFFFKPLSILTKYKTNVTPKIDNIFIFINISTIFQSSSGETTNDRYPINVMFQ